MLNHANPGRLYCENFTSIGRKLTNHGYSGKLNDAIIEVLSVWPTRVNASIEGVPPQELNVPAQFSASIEGVSPKKLSVVDTSWRVH